MSECQDIRGEWGGICPGCGQRLPARQPRLSSWMAQRHIDPHTSEQARLAAPAALRINRNGVRRTWTPERLRQTLMLVRERGTHEQAARILGVSRQNVSEMVRAAHDLGLT
jgi:hypothetical protein